jgi:uncharacterized protein YceK
MKTALTLLFASTALLCGCATSVKHGPANPPPPSTQANAPESETYLDEPQPAPITQKDVPANESSLKKTGPDKQLAQ